MFKRGSRIDATVSKDLDNCFSKASSSFGSLSKRAWQSHSLRLSTKIQVSRAVVIPTLLYGAETWVLYRKQIRLLERFHQRCLRSILGIKWQDHVSNEEVLKRASLPSIEQSSSASSKKESTIVVLQERVTKIS